METNEKKNLGNPVVVAIITAVLILFLIFVMIPQNFWVNMSIKFFK